MNRTEAVQLCRLVKALCPSQAIDQYTPEAWALVLAHVDYDDAKLAVQQLSSLELEPGKARYIDPGHIIGQVRRIRAKRIDDHGPIDPPAGLNAGEYLHWLRNATNAIAGGRPPAGVALRDNPAGQERIRQLTASVGDMPGGD